MRERLYLGGVRVDFNLISKVKEDLTFRVFRVGEETPEIVLAYRQDGESLIVPREYAEKILGLSGISFSTNRLQSYWHNRISLKNYQTGVVKNIVDRATNDVTNSINFIVKAHTGSGKTIMALEAASLIGEKTLIVVDQSQIMNDWISTIINKFCVPPSLVGVVRGDKIAYSGKDIVVAMLQTLYSRDYSREFYTYFGMVVFDEIHAVGAPRLSEALLQFPARVRIGLSADPDRKDALNGLLRANIGEVGPVLNKVHNKSAVWIVQTPYSFSPYFNLNPKTSLFINQVSKHKDRNALLAQIIKIMHSRGRRILAMGDRIRQLEILMDLCVEAGIPLEDMGLCVRRKTDNTVVKDDELIDIKNKASVIFATYSLFSKGVDLPDFDCGVECTPRSSILQPHGRILRNKIGKMRPVWITVRDTKSYRAESQLLNRIKDFQVSNADIKLWNIQDRKLQKLRAGDLELYLKKSVRTLRKEIVEKNYTRRTKPIATR